MLQIAINKLERHNKFTIVFIGGSHDGEVREVERIPPAVNMQPPVNASVGGIRQGEEVKPMIAQSYKRLDLGVSHMHQATNTAVILYAHEALTDTEVLNILLTRYVQGASNAND